jgi:hypothetical protein
VGVSRQIAAQEAGAFVLTSSRGASIFLTCRYRSITCVYACMHAGCCGSDSEAPTPQKETEQDVRGPRTRPADPPPNLYTHTHTYMYTRKGKARQGKARQDTRLLEAVAAEDGEVHAVLPAHVHHHVDLRLAPSGPRLVARLLSWWSIVWCTVCTSFRAQSTLPVMLWVSRPPFPKPS